MIYNTETTIDGAIINIDVNYDFFKEDGVVTIRINSIMNGSLEVSELISSSELENIKDKCEIQYVNNMFNEIEELMNKTWYGLDNSQKEV